MFRLGFEISLIPVESVTKYVFPKPRFASGLKITLEFSFRNSNVPETRTPFNFKLNVEEVIEAGSIGSEKSATTVVFTETQSS